MSSINHENGVYCNVFLFWAGGKCKLSWNPSAFIVGERHIQNHVKHLTWYFCKTSKRLKAAVNYFGKTVQLRCFKGFRIRSSVGTFSVQHFWDIYYKTLESKFNKVLWYSLWVGDCIDFQKTFLLNINIWTRILFVTLPYVGKHSH